MLSIVLLNRQRIEKDHREKYIKVLVALENLCSKWYHYTDKEVKKKLELIQDQLSDHPKMKKLKPHFDRSMEKRMKKKLELIYDQPTDDPEMKKWKANFERTQNAIKNCFGGNIGEFEKSYPNKDIMDYLTKLRRKHYKFLNWLSNRNL